MRLIAWLSALLLFADARGEIRVSSILNCSKLVRYVKPLYPAEAKRKRIEGIVRLRAHVTATGELRDLEVLQGDPVLTPAALRAVNKWRYTPCLIDSQPVALITEIDVGFTLNQ